MNPTLSDKAKELILSGRAKQIIKYHDGKATIILDSIRIILKPDAIAVQLCKDDVCMAYFDDIDTRLASTITLKDIRLSIGVTFE